MHNFRYLGEVNIVAVFFEDESKSTTFCHEGWFPCQDDVSLGQHQSSIED